MKVVGLEALEAAVVEVGGKADANRGKIGGLFDAHNQQALHLRQQRVAVES